MQIEHASELSPADERARPLDAGVVEQDVPHHEDKPGALRQLDELRAVGQGERHRLLDEHVPPSEQGMLGDGVMARGVARRRLLGFDLRRLQQLIEVVREDDVGVLLGAGAHEAFGIEVGDARQKRAPRARAKARATLRPQGPAPTTPTPIDAMKLNILAVTRRYRNAQRSPMIRAVMAPSRSRLSSTSTALGLAAASLAGCAAPATVATGSISSRAHRRLRRRPRDREQLKAFPSMTYESVVRFSLPDGEHRPIRLRLQAGAEGKLTVTIYDTTVLETPGEVLRTVSCDISKDDVSNGSDGRWVVVDLADMKPIKGVVWIGVRKSGGEPTMWASSVVSGQAFVRNNDPNNFMGLLPTKRTPMLRLEIAP